MAEIKLSNLNPAGSELLQDSESFLNELNEQEMGDIVGGSRSFTIVNITGTVATEIGNTVNANTAGNINTVVIP